MTIDILRNSVMSIVEGISVTLSQKEDTGVSFEQLWASEDERLKLDIYYREAVSDLEKSITKWLGASTGQFSLEYKDEGDYTLKLTMRYWPMKLKGLLGNKLQDYMVHAILAGWLNNFTGLDIKADYAAMAASDLTDIQEILCKKYFDFVTTDRTEDDQMSDGVGGEVSVGERHEDMSDGVGGEVSVGERHEDDTPKNMIVNRTIVSNRKRDAVPQTIHREQTDWSDGVDEEMQRIVSGRPHTVIIREPIQIPPEPKVIPCRPCKHRAAPFETPPENPNEPEAEPLQDSKGVTVEIRREWDY